MKKLALAAFLLLVIGCEKENIEFEKNNSETGNRIIYKGKTYRSLQDVSAYLTDASTLFTDYSNDATVDYLFDSQEDFSRFVQTEFTGSVRELMTRHLSDEREPTAHGKALDDWSDFSLQYYDEYCDDPPTPFCFQNSSFFPTGQNNNISANGCGYNPKSIGVGVPAGGHLSFTIYKNINCNPFSSNQHCYPVSRSYLFGAGSRCVDVKFGSCLAFFPGLIPSQARSIKYSCSRD
jgi:hypothetical protein